MKIVISGGSGQIGTILAKAFHSRGDDVVIGRGAGNASWHTVNWDGRSQGVWSSELDGADIVINRAGRSANCRYTDENRRQIYATQPASASACLHRHG